MHVSIYTDGASRGNPGDLAYAFIFVKPNGEIFERMSGFIGGADDDIAECVAIIKALEWVEAKYPNLKFILYSSSQVAINQINGKDSVLHFKKYYQRKAKRIIKGINVDFAYAPKTNQYITTCDKMCEKLLNNVEKIEAEFSHG